MKGAAAGLALAAALAAPPAVYARSSPEELFDAQGCRACHRLGSRGGGSGPDLTLAGARRGRAWIEEWLRSPGRLRPGTPMPEPGLSPSDRGALAAFLAEQRGQAWGASRPWEGRPRGGRGALLYERAGCAACHGAPGARKGRPNPGAVGGFVPGLAAVSEGYTRAELISRLARGGRPAAEPGREPEAAMPAWGEVLGAPELEELADYLLSRGGPSGEEW